MDWTKRDSGTTVREVVMHNSGMTEEELASPKSYAPDTVQNLVQAAEMVRCAISQGTPISIMGDYDADGITASSILYLTLKALGVIPTVRLPRRMSEGYGLSTNAVREFSKGLLITVDNGIAAHEAIAEAKRLGFQVIIMDHHLPAETLPPADILVDPHAFPVEDGFEDYCGAGLAYKLTEILLDDPDLLDSLCCLAAVGTVADSVPLRGDNRYIVKRGLQAIRRKRGPIGLNTLVSVAEIYECNEKDIGFRLGPMLNAAGRMYDDGARYSFDALTADNEEDAKVLCEQLVKINEERKESTLRNMEYVEGIIQDDCLYGDVPLVVVADGMQEGIVGIITGRLAEKYKVPTFVLTDSETPNIFKGSGRTYGDVNLKTDILDKVSGLLLHGGGHAAAAGITVEAGNLNSLVAAMHHAMDGYVPKEQDVLEYDLSIPANSIEETWRELERYAPYGEGNPEPVFLVPDVILSPKAGEIAKYMGKQAEHVKLYGPGFSAVCFGRSADYRNMGCPSHLDFIGTLSRNVFRYSAEIQLETIDFRKTPSKAGTTSLLDALKKNGTI